jgi:hypothetical protein
MTMRRRNVLVPGDTAEPEQLVIPSFTLSIPESQRGRCYQIARELLQTAQFTLPSIMTDLSSRAAPGAFDADIVHQCLAVLTVEESDRKDVTEAEFQAILKRVQNLSAEYVFWTCYTVRNYSQPHAEAHEWIEKQGTIEYEVHSPEKDPEALALCLIEQVLTQGPSSCRRNLVASALFDLKPLEHLIKVLALIADKQAPSRSFFKPITLDEREKNLRRMPFKDIVQLCLAQRNRLPGVQE